MHSLKTTCAGQIFALAKPHDSVGKRTRNRIPKEERKALVESFIKKHQSLNNGSFPSLSLTHREVGGSFYTIREIVREIIQENRVLGPGDMLLEGKGSDHLLDKSLSSTILMDPVPPLSLPPDGFHSASDYDHTFSSEAGESRSPEKGENINGSQVSLEGIGSDVLNRGEVNGTQTFKEDVELLVHVSVGSTDISRTKFEASHSKENDSNHDARLHDRVQTIYDSFATKPQDEELDVDNEDKGFESEDSEPVNSDRNDAGAAMTEMANLTMSTAGTIDIPVETVVEIFPLSSVTSTTESLDVQPSELDKVCEGGTETETKIETESSIINPVDLGEISSPTSAVLENNGTEVISGQTPNHSSVPMEKKVGEENINPASVTVECVDTKEAVVVNIHETKDFSNGALTTEQKMPTSGTESGSFKNGIAKVDTVISHARNEVAHVEKATMEKQKLDASDSFSSEKGSSATLNRIKPKSWKEKSNKTEQETNPLLEILKSLVTAFVKFWSE